MVKLKQIMEVLKKSDKGQSCKMKRAKYVMKDKQKE